MLCTTNTVRKKAAHHASKARRELKAVVQQLKIANNGIVPRDIALAVRTCEQTIAQLESLTYRLRQEIHACL